MQPPENDFIRTVEPLLFILGGAMTLGLCIFLAWLIRTMIREDRAQRESEERRRAEGRPSEEEA
jgi:hypothetical protein